MVDEITIIGSRCGPFKAALDLLSRKLIDVGSFIHARYKLDDAVTAMEKAQEAGGVEGVVGCKLKPGN